MNITLRMVSLVALLVGAAAMADEAPGTAPKEWSNLKYRNIGPSAGGRTTRVVGLPGDPLTYYVATASGGVWKSEDGGVTFKPIFDDQTMMSIGSIAVAPSDSNVVYVGTGEANIRGNVCPGNGIYKSVDAGKTWKHVWKEIGQIGTMVVHPKNADIAYAAVLGHAFGPNQERGVYRTIDGGKTWKKVLYFDVDTGASDVAIDPSNPRNILAGMWPARRKPWEMTSGGPGGGLHLSNDGGETWTKVGPAKDGKENGLPQGPWGKVGVAYAPSDSKVVYAIIEATKGGLFRSNDGGETWALTSDEPRLRQRAWYYSTITVHPTNPDIVICPQVQLLKSIDGGKKFTALKGLSHSDHHDIWIDPKNPKRMIDSHDAGVDITTDGGKTWRAPPLPIGQFYHVACDNQFPYRVMGCMQDLGSCSGPSNSLNRDGILIGDWYSVGGGEAGFAVPDPSDPNIVYAGEYMGYISRYDHRTKQSRYIGIYPFNQSGHGAEVLRYRFQWTSPIMVSQHNSTLYHASNMLFRTSNGGQNWDRVSADLTRNDKNKQKWSGGPITGDNTGVEVYGTIFALAESPRDKKVMWAGSDDGLIHVSTDDCSTWDEVGKNIPDLPDWGTVSCIDVSAHQDGTAFVVVDNHRMDDYRPHLWMTKDNGVTWTRLTEGLPVDAFCRVVREDPKKKGLLYLGTEKGIFVSHDTGKTWEPMRLNMPAVPVTDIVVKNNDLVVATQGRSLWIFDDLTPIREWSKAISNKAGHVFTPSVTYRWRTNSAVSHHQTAAAGENPGGGATLSYYLKNEAKKPIVVEIYDANDNRINRLVAKDKKEKDDDGDSEDVKDKEIDAPGTAGINRLSWDLTHAGAKFIPKARVDLGDPSTGPMVAPGTYTVKIMVDNLTLTAKVEVKMDPRVVMPRGAAPAKTKPVQLEIMPRVVDGKEGAKVEQAPNVTRRSPTDVIQDEAKEQEKFTIRVRNEITKVTEIVDTVRTLQKQIKLQQELLGSEQKSKAYIKSLKALGIKLVELEGKVHNPKAKISYDILAQKGGAKMYSQLTWLLEVANSGDGPPTQGMQEFADELAMELQIYTMELETLKQNEITQLIEQAKKLNVPTLWLPSDKKDPEPKKKEPKKKKE